MTSAKFDHAFTRRSSRGVAILAAVAGDLAIASPVCADPIVAGGVAGTAALAPQREGTTIVPGSVDREQSPDIVSQPAPPADPPLNEARPEAHAPTAAQLKQGVPLRCDDPAGFFPHVAACKLPWRAITPIVPAVIEPEAQPRAKSATLAAPALRPTVAPAPGPALSDAGDEKPTHAHAASDQPAAQAASNSDAHRRKDETAHTQRQAAAPAIAPTEAPAPAKPATQKLAAAEPQIRLTPPKHASAAPDKAPPAPQPERSVTVALPAAAPPLPPALPKAAAPPHQELAAVIGDLPPKPDRPVGAGSDAAWSVPRSANAGAVLTAQSRQASSGGGVVAMVEAACNTRDKQFSLRAALVDTAGEAIIPLTERMQIGDAEMQPAYFHTELAFNKLVLTRGYGGTTLSDATANTLLSAKQALYEIKTNEGTVLIKIAATDGNLRKVLQACQSRD